MYSHIRSVWSATRLATVKESPMAAAEPVSHDQPPGAAAAAHGEMGNQLSSLTIRQPFGIEPHSSRHIFHARRASAPPPAAVSMAGRSLRLQSIQSESMGSVVDDDEEDDEEVDDADSRLCALQPRGAITPRERRRSSWAAGAFQTFQPMATSGGHHETLPPDQLYKQFIQIRDAVLRKRQVGSVQNIAGEGAEDAAIGGAQGSGSCEATACISDGNAAVGGCAHHNNQPQSADHVDRGRPMDRLPSTVESPPDSPYSSAVAIAMHAACASRAALPPQAAAAAGANGVGQMDEPQWTGVNVHRMSHQSPEMVDLADYYRSPAASSCGTTQRTSPFEGAVANASDCVSYNELYGKGSARLGHWLAAPIPCQNASAKDVGCDRPSCRRAISKLEALSSIPATDSLFSLLPSGEPQPSISAIAGEAPLQQQHQASQPAGCCITGGTASHVLVWQEEPASGATNGPAPVPKAGRGSGRSESLQPVYTASSSMRLSMRDSRSTSSAGNSCVEATDSKGDIVVRGGRGGDDGFTPDYLKAVQSAAQRTLLSRSRVQSSSSLRAGGTSGLNSHSLLNSGWAGVAVASNSATTPHASAAKAGGGGVEARPMYDGYVPLPLAGLPPPPVIPRGNDQAGLPPPLAMYAMPSVAAAIAAVVRKCLGKGFPFAVVPVKHFAAAMMAAEQQDGPLAFHIISTHGMYYPGLGRHAASSGGTSSAFGTGDVSRCAGGDGSSGSGAPKVGAGGSTLGKSASSTAVAAAATSVRQLLASGDALHVMSPGEYQRMQLAAQYSLRQLQEMLVAQPTVSAAAMVGPHPGSFPSSSSAQDRDAGGPAAGAPGGSRMLRQHRRGSSICGESNLSTIVRFQSGLEGQGPAAAPARAGHPCSLADPATRDKALIQAAQLGNMARVAHLVQTYGADVNAVESAQSSQQHGTPQGVRGVLAGAFTGAGAAAGGRTVLHYAAMAGSFGVVQLLLHHGAFIGVRDGTGRTAYDLARRKGHDAVAQLLSDAAERRREVVRNCAAESRTATAAAAPRVGYPPPIPPRSKQQRSNSAPDSAATTDGAATSAGSRKAATAAHNSVAMAATNVAAGICAPAEEAPLLPSLSPRGACVCGPAKASSDGNSTLLEDRLSDCAAAAPGLKDGSSGHVGAAQLPAAPSKEDRPSGAPVQAPSGPLDPSAAASGREASDHGPPAHDETGQPRRKGGLLACILCGA